MCKIVSYFKILYLYFLYANPTLIYVDTGYCMVVFSSSDQFALWLFPSYNKWQEMNYLSPQSKDLK